MSRDAIGRLNDALSRFGRVGLCTLPTPLEPMTRLSRHLAGPRLWVKREVPACLLYTSDAADD